MSATVRPVLEELFNQPDKEQLRRALPLHFVCTKLGIHLDRNGYALCPFHADTSPSFYLWDGDDGVQRWWCQPCGFGGDLFDLIKRVLGCTFPQSIDVAQGFFNEIPPGTTPPDPVREKIRREIDPTVWATEVSAARHRAEQQPGILSALTGLADAHNETLCQKWDVMLRTTFGWGVTETGWVLMPHWDVAGNLIGCKMRGMDGNRQSLPGSSYSSLYGSWLRQDQRDTILLEGETDAAYAAFQAAEERIGINVLALPSGAGQPPDPSWIDFVKNSRTLYFALDPDVVGVAATRQWLGQIAHGDIRVCALPLGQDLRAARPSLRHLLDNAKRPLQIPTDIDTQEGGYIRWTKDGEPRTITTWTIEPTAQLIGGDAGFDVVLKTRGTLLHTTIRLADMANIGTLRKWANERGEIFSGMDVDVQAISKLVKARGAITPEIFQTAVVGVHTPPEEYRYAGPSIVFPYGHIGKLPWRYVPNGKQAANVSDRVLLPLHNPTRFNWRWLKAFLALSSPEVTQPLFAWIGAAARRHEVREFPLLFIGGSSGAGKSTIARLAMRLAGSNIEVDLGASTKFVLMTTLASTTTIPIFVDEWTALSNQEARLAFKGFIPIIYTGGIAERGQADLSTVPYIMKGPVIVAGEDTFILTREQERMVSILPTRRAQNVEAYRYIQTAPLELFAQAYGEWLAATDPAELPSMDIQAPDRVEHNRRVLLAGWNTLRQFLIEMEILGERVPELPVVPDLSCFERAVEETTDNVYLQALQQGKSLEDQSGRPLVWQDSIGVYVRPEPLIGALKRGNIELDLPGKSRAMLNYFRETYEVVSDNHIKYPPPFSGEVRAHLIKGLTL